jgi:hypothetical protein
MATSASSSFGVSTSLADVQVPLLLVNVNDICVEESSKFPGLPLVPSNVRLKVPKPSTLPDPPSVTTGVNDPEMEFDPKICDTVTTPMFLTLRSASEAPPIRYVLPPLVRESKVTSATVPLSEDLL